MWERFPINRIATFLKYNLDTLLPTRLLFQNYHLHLVRKLRSWIASITPEFSPNAIGKHWKYLALSRLVQKFEPIFVDSSTFRVADYNKIVWKNKIVFVQKKHFFSGRIPWTTRNIYTTNVPSEKRLLSLAVDRATR